MDILKGWMEGWMERSEAREEDIDKQVQDRGLLKLTKFTDLDDVEAMGEKMLVEKLLNPRPYEL